MATTSPRKEATPQAIGQSNQEIDWATQGEQATTEEFLDMVKRAEVSPTLSQREFTKQMDEWRERMF